MWRNAVDFGVYLVVRVAIAVIQALPLSACEKVAEHLATLFGRVLRVRGHVVEKNLRIAFPDMTAAERDAITWQMWRHLILMIAEIAQTPRKVHETNWKEHSHIVNQEQFVRTLLSGRPLVLISGHFGNFELGGYLMGLFGFPTYTVARALDNPYLDRFVNDFRGRTGQYMLPKKGSGADIQARARARRHPHAARRSGRRPTTVLGRISSASRPRRTKRSPCSRSATKRRRWSATPAAIGRAAALRSRPRGDLRSARSEFRATARVPLLAQWYTDHLENLIRRSPGQYWWLHRRWKGRAGRPHEARRMRSAAKWRKHEGPSHSETGIRVSERRGHASPCLLSTRPAYDSRFCQRRPTSSRPATVYNFRPFRNTDPPRIAEIWRDQPPQRGLMQPVTAGAARAARLLEAVLRPGRA